MLALLCAGCASSTIPAVHSEPERLALARRMMDQRRYPSAIELLKTYVQNNGGSSNVDQAHYLLGLSYLSNHEFPMAVTEFELVTREYPESDSTPSAACRLGEAIFAQARPPDFDQEQTARAIEQFQHYLDTYPGHWLNPTAVRELNLARSRIASKLLANAELYMKLRLPGPARVYLERIRDDYGDTVLLPRAMYGLARCLAIEGFPDQAIVQYREVESRFPGTREAVLSSRDRSRLEHNHRL